jgi:hypothetical protein
MLKKVFILDIFGKHYDWMDKYIANCNTLAKDGWEWIIITDQDDLVLQTQGNVKAIPMTIAELEYRIKVKLELDVDLNAKRSIDGRAIGEFHPAFGLIFEEFILGADFWGYTNNDVIYGRLSNFVSDKFLEGIDIFGNDPEQMNGIFSLMRNTPEVNNIFKEVPDWRTLLRGHIFTAFDEIQITKAVIGAKANGQLRVEFRDWREGDRLYANMRAMHQPTPQIKLEDNGALINTITKQEIMMFHFGGVKKWCL